MKFHDQSSSSLDQSSPNLNHKLVNDAFTKIVPCPVVSLSPIHMLTNGSPSVDIAGDTGGLKYQALTSNESRQSRGCAGV